MNDEQLLQPRTTEVTAIWALCAQLIMIVLGYTAACVAGAIFAAIAVHNLGTQQIANDMALVFETTVFTASLTFLAMQSTFIPAAVAIAITEGLKLRRLVTYLAAGCIVGLLAALPVRWVVSGTPMPDVSGSVIQLTVASSAVGAFFYWLVAGRTAGRWLELRWFERNKR
ncbi:MAG: hypothetical protein AAGF45_01625 [Pseudomonadota bacterium]